MDEVKQPKKCGECGRYFRKKRNLEREGLIARARANVAAGIQATISEVRRGGGNG